MATLRNVVIGTSSGDGKALCELVVGLTSDVFPPLCDVFHTAPQSPAVLGGVPTHVARPIDAQPAISS